MDYELLMIHPASGLLQIEPKTVKKEWPHNLAVIAKKLICIPPLKFR